MAMPGHISDYHKESRVYTYIFYIVVAVSNVLCKCVVDSMIMQDLCQYFRIE